MKNDSFLLAFCNFNARIASILQKNVYLCSRIMEIFGQTSIQSILFFALYGVTGAMPLVAALYLLLRPCNVFSASITPPVRLRRWAAAFFAFSALTHVWWLLFYVYSGDLNSAAYKLIVITDCVLLLTTIAGTMLSMLQDRRRPVWPVLVAMLPFVALVATLMIHPSELLQQIAKAYLLLHCLLFAVYMVFAIRRYGRWLNDNYADLEHKRVWLSQAVAFFCMLAFVLYIVAENMVLIYCLHIVDLVLVFLLLWRVETLPELDAPSADETFTPSALERPVCETTSAESASVPDTMPVMPTQPEQPSANPINIDVDQMEQLLKERCEATQLYLQHDLTLSHLAQALGTNRTYLGMYFSRQGTTYNSYINDLRIDCFVRLVREANAAQRPFTAQELAAQSGYRSYRTFSVAFRKRKGQSVTAWMNESPISR